MSKTVNVEDFGSRTGRCVAVGAMEFRIRPPTRMIPSSSRKGTSCAMDQGETFEFFDIRVRDKSKKCRCCVFRTIGSSYRSSSSREPSLVRTRLVY